MGTFGLMDADIVEVSHPQRQIPPHHAQREAAPRGIRRRDDSCALRPDVNVIPLPTRSDVESVMDVLKEHDLVVDGLGQLRHALPR
jgi:molybdopterin/thiamine biosynthesis adenylyltransferase